MGPDINELIKRVNEYDGILITNCFGTSTNIDLYEKFCKKNNKILLFDNATASMTYYNEKNHLNYGNGTMVSLHHTKPIGFGEGGFIVFDKKMLEHMEKTICFGYTKTDRHNFNIYANNFKMSEIACIYISEYLKNLNVIYNHHTKIIEYFIKQLNINNLNKINLFKSYSQYNKSLLACVPLVFETNISIDIFTKYNIEAKKYYFPLDKSINSNNIFNRIICLSLNLDVDEKIIDLYITILKDI